MTQPQDGDFNAVGGASIQSEAPQSPEKGKGRLQGQRTIPNFQDPYIDLANRAVDSTSWHLSQMYNVHSTPKYGYGPEVHYYSQGALSLLPKAGLAIFGSSQTEANNGSLKIDQNNSKLTSTATSTTLGSTEIDTLNGKEMNPLSPTFPSTSFTPKKTWVSKLFPIPDIEMIAMISILQLVQAVLYKGISNLKNDNRTNIQEQESVIDMGTVIIDNADRFI